MFDLGYVLAHQFARQVEETVIDGPSFHIQTVSNGVCSSAGGGSLDCGLDSDVY